MSTDLAEQARAIRPLIEKHAEEANLAGRMDAETVAAVQDAGLYWALVPAELGGAELDIRSAFEVIEELSYADGSTGWSTMACVVLLGLAGSHFGDDAVAQIFSDRAARAAGQIAPIGTATAAGDRFRVQGRFGFCSGGDHASWIFGGFREMSGDKPVRMTSGAPNILAAAVARDDVEFVENWEVLGLEATGSHDFIVHEQLVDHSFTFPFLDARAVRGTATHQMGPNGITAMGHAAFAIGVARRALDEIAQLAASKKRIGRAILVESEAFRRDFATSWIRTSAARSEIVNALTEMEHAGAGTSLAIRARVRLAACHVVDTAVEAASLAYGHAGSSGLRRGSVIHRCFRDLQAARQHVFTDHNVVVDTGQVLLGTAAPTMFL